MKDVMVRDIRCTVHGPMRYRMASDIWECAGFDGEGCDSMITSEEAARLDSAPDDLPGSCTVTRLNVQMRRS